MTLTKEQKIEIFKEKFEGIRDKLMGNSQRMVVVSCQVSALQKERGRLLKLRDGLEKEIYDLQESVKEIYDLQESVNV